MSFLDSDYLLGSSTAKTIFQAVKDLPILDAHNHADVRRIALNIPFDNLWQLTAATDHYVWEVMRKCGVSEEFITGPRTDREKWNELARVFPKIAGNPVYEWVHLDLRILGLGGIILSSATADELWEKGIARLASEECRPQRLLRTMNVETMCSTDDPADTLEFHRTAEKAFGYRMIRPTWRPDRMFAIEKKTWNSAVDALGSRFGKTISDLSSFQSALRESHAFFVENGALASDHGIEHPFRVIAEESEAAAIFAKVRSGKTATKDEVEAFGGFMLAFAAELDAAADMVFQMHVGAVRDVRDSLFRSLGPDSGGDVSDHTIDLVKPLAMFLNRFDGRLKVVLYCLDPGHQASLVGISRAFGAKVRPGSAWWLCDTPVGMRRQLEYIGSVDVLSQFAGMVSDSRKILSYGSRFEMFRRVLSDVLGMMVDRGQMPAEIARETAKEICYAGPKSFFGFSQNRSR